MIKNNAVVEQYSLFPEVPTNRDLWIETMAFRCEARNNLIQERLDNPSKPAVALKASGGASVASSEEKRVERAAAKDKAKAEKAVAAEKLRLAVREKWAAWKPSCMEVSGACASLILIGGAL